MIIDVTKVRSVLMADGWHRVAERTFTVDAYEYASSTGGDGNGRTGSPGFRFKDEAGYVLSGPLSTVLATQAST